MEQSSQKTSAEEKLQKQIEDYWPNEHYRNWRAWGSWFSWGSPVGLSLGWAIFIMPLGFFLWILHIIGLLN